MLQFPCPVPLDIEVRLRSPVAQFIVRLALVGISTALISFFLPRPLFCRLLKIAFPFLPESTEEDRHG